MGKRYFFEHVNAIDSFHFFLALAKSDNRYSLYKRFATTYAASDSHNYGVIQTGKEYNEYKDDNKYYVIDETNNSASQPGLKAKDIKAVFASQKQQVDSYFKQHRDDEIDERFLTGLVNYLNQQ